MTEAQEIYDMARKVSVQEYDILNRIQEAVAAKYEDDAAMCIILGNHRIKLCKELQHFQDSRDKASETVIDTETFPVSGSVILGVPVFRENNADFGLKVLFESGDSVVL